MQGCKLLLINLITIKYSDEMIEKLCAS